MAAAAPGLSNMAHDDQEAASGEEMVRCPRRRPQRHLQRVPLQPPPGDSRSAAIAEGIVPTPACGARDRRPATRITRINFTLRDASLFGANPSAHRACTTILRAWQPGTQVVRGIIERPKALAAHTTSGLPLTRVN